MIGPIHQNLPRNAEELTARRAERFDRLDADDNGILTDDEIDTLIGNISEHKGVSLDLETFTAALDKDGSGEITAEEFQNLQRPEAEARTPRVPRRFRNLGERSLSGAGAFSKLNEDDDKAAGPPLGFHHPRGIHPLTAIRNYGEVVDAEADQENAPPTIVVPV